MSTFQTIYRCQYKVVNGKVCFSTVPLDVPRHLSTVGPIVTTTRLGVVIYGPMPEEDVVSNNRALHIRKSTNTKVENYTVMENLMRNYFDVESFGIKANIQLLLSNENERALNILNESTRKVDGRYESRLLWKENVKPFPDTYPMALRRLCSVENKMKRDNEYATEYCQKINDYIAKGYARKLSDAEKEIQNKRVFYLPHFGVKNVNKKGVRIVFDAAAEVNNVSLNKCLLSGPDINNSLISIILKFREAPIAVCGDIKEMFHQIKIAKEDQDSQRFLWRNGESDNSVEIFVMERMIFGATCSPAIAQYVKNLNAKNFEEKCPRAVKGIIERHYVDDYVDCFNTDEEAIDVVNNVISIHRAGGFELRNIVSNSEKVRTACGHSANGKNNGGEFLLKDNIERILGIHWLPENDIFCFRLNLHKIEKSILEGRKVPTKREMLSLNMSIYDPYGFVCDFMIGSKILMQHVWKAGIQWDEELPVQIYECWKMWLQELYKLEQYKVPRCYGKYFLNCHVELHIFADASEEAMAVVAYWRTVSVDGVNVVFVMGKTACAPTRYHTIPKLELQAATMGVRLKELIIKNHLKNINKYYFWTDSRTVVQWIRSDHRIYKQFVANRVGEILESSQISDWKLCPGNINPADYGTRAKFPINYEIDGRWKNGPDFLRMDESHWPLETQMKNCSDDSGSELRSKHIILFTNQVRPEIPEFNRFSKYSRLRRTMAWVRLYILNLLYKLKGIDCIKGELTVEEEIWAENHLCQEVQKSCFANEITCIQKNKSVANTSSIKSLNPFIGVDGLLRGNGRLVNAPNLSIEAKNPIILPRKHLFTRLLVESYHTKFQHININISSAFLGIISSPSLE
ncbi:uncharacterized protein LOC142226012 isoform X1 [Haematobia irritans]|uniref:uncharacterized protein LOC142226012 isoform X1 n=1 Tax=Haematobia irritans TaxID=7368 RepID=UPI003F4FF1C7